MWRHCMPVHNELHRRGNSKLREILMTTTLSGHLLRVRWGKAVFFKSLPSRGLFRGKAWHLPTAQEEGATALLYSDAVAWSFRCSVLVKESRVFHSRRGNQRQSCSRVKPFLAYVIAGGGPARAERPLTSPTIFTALFISAPNECRQATAFALH